MIQLRPPASEIYAGKLIQLAGYRPAVLLIGHRRSRAPGKLIRHGQLVLFYAFPLLYSTNFIFPQLAIDDFRREYHGTAAIDFMLNKGNSYPRADAIGLSLLDGQRKDYYMKEVDLAGGLHAFAYESNLVGLPLGQVGAAVWLDEKVDVDQGLIRFDVNDGALLPLAAGCFKCNPALLASLPDLLPASRGA